jgi:hypothetical protein
VRLSGRPTGGRFEDERASGRGLRVVSPKTALDPRHLPTRLSELIGGNERPAATMLRTTIAPSP